MRVFYISSEFPYPPNHGGRVDIWNRLQALNFLGHNVFLISWAELVKGDLPDENAIETVKGKTEESLIFRINRDLKRILNLIKYPSFVAARLLDDKDYDETLSKVISFKPDVVFIDSVYAGATGLKFAKDLKLPVGLRLHNMEYLYMKGQYSLCKSPRKKLSLGIGLINLKRYEENLIKNVTAFFDISLDDLATRTKKGMKNGFWLPPIHRSTVIPKSDISTNITEQFDICFLGNLNTPNNVNGLFWFINTVLPFVKETLPQVTVLIMGSNPDNAIINLCHGRNITLLANPTNPEEYFKVSKVLINPVRSGSGVNIKAIDMLFTDNKVVSTSYGVKGLPKQFYETFSVSDSPSVFAESILAALSKDASFDITQRIKMRSVFEQKNIEIIEKVLLNKDYQLGKND